MKVVVTGSRSITSKDYVRACLRWAYTEMGPIDVLHQGGAAGVDTLARDIVTEAGIHSATWPALWGYYGKPAGGVRNIVMVRACGADYGIAIWDGGSRGTRHAMEAMERHSLPHIVFVVGAEPYVWRPNEP